MNLINTLIWGDCFKILPLIPDQSIDLIITDPPYNITECAWDCSINLELMWKEFNRILKPNGIIIIFSSQPFTSFLICSNIKQFKCEWIWKKHRPSNFCNKNLYPMKYHENIEIFADKIGIFNPQMEKRQSNKVKDQQKEGNQHILTLTQSNIHSKFKNTQIDYSKYDPDKRLPSSIIDIHGVVNNSEEKTEHSTQKPTELYEYLIKTYTHSDMIVLDPFAGSITITEACLNLKRNWIAIELEEKFIQIGLNRIKKYFDHSITINKQKQSFGTIYSFKKPLDFLLQK